MKLMGLKSGVVGVAADNAEWFGIKGRGAMKICKTMRRAIAALTLPVGLVVVSQHAMAGVVSWDGGGNGTSWHDPLNWSLDAVPGRTDDVLITLAGSYTVSVDAPALAASLTVGAGNGDQTLSLVSLGTLSVGGSATVDTGGTLDLADGLIIGGTLDIAIDAAVIVNDVGSVCCTSVLDVTAGIVNNGTMLLDGTAAAATVAAGGGLTNGTTGSIEFQGDASIDGTLVNNAGGLVAGLGSVCCAAVLNIAGTFTNNGLVELTSDFAQNAGITVTGGALTNGGTISILPGAGGGRCITGQIVNQSGGLVTIDADLLLDGVGAQHSNLGMISMGLGNVTVSGATSFGNTGLINIGAGRLLNIIDGSFDPTSGSIVGDGGVGVNQVINWTGGALGGNLTTQAAGGLSIGGASDKHLSGNHVLNNDGLATWNGTGEIQFGGPGFPTFNNNGEFQVQGFDQTIRHPFGNTGTFNNPPGATFRKLAGTGLTEIQQVTFISGGDVLVEGGTLRLQMGEITGMLDISAGATVLFENSSGIPYVLQGATVDGQGTVSVIGNRTEVLEPVDPVWPHLIVAGIIDFQGDTTLPSLHFASGGASLIGPATITVEGPMLWEQGGPRGSGVLDFDPIDPADTMLITGALRSVLEGAQVVNNFGTAIWDMGEFKLGGTFNNHGTFEVEVFDGSLAGPHFAGTFNNFGTFHKLPGTGPLLIWTLFNNSGLVELADGVTELSVTSTHTGDFDVASGAILWFSACNPSVLEPGSTIDGQGTVRITGSLIATADPLWPNLELNGTLTLNSDTTVPSLSLGTEHPGTSLKGAATLTVDGPMLWVSGGVRNSGTLDFAPSNPSDTMVLTGPMDKIITSGGVVNNFGTLQWQEGDLASGGGTLNNHGTLEVQGVDLVFLRIQDQGGLGSLNNLGSFIKLPGTGTTTFNVQTAFTNGGLVDLQGGTLVIQPTNAEITYRQTAGETRLSGGDLLADLNFPLVFEGGRLTGSGMVTAEVSNVAATVAPGLSVGTLQIGADYTQEFGARLAIELGGLIPGDQHDVLAVTGIAALGGELNVVPINGFLPKVGEDFVVVTAGIVMGEFDEVTGPGEYTVAYNANNVTITVSVAPLPCPWDCDSGESTDGTVGIVDFLTLLAQWGGPGSCDFDGGGVGINDFLALLAHWGPCP